MAGDAQLMFSTGTGQSPVLAPDWRWRRALAIVAAGGYATVKRDGRLVQRTVRCMRCLNTVVTDRGVRGAVKSFPDIYLAMKVRNESGRRPLEILARILAGQSDRSIARHVGLPARAVAAYVELFFDVRPRLTAGTWIRRVIGIAPDRPPSIESLLLLQCWRRGPSAIEPWLDFLDHRLERHDLGTELGRRRASLQLLVDVLQLPNDEATAQTLFKTIHLTYGLRAKTVVSEGAAGVFSRIGSRRLGQIVWMEHPHRDPDCEIRARNPAVDDEGREYGGAMRVA